MAFDGRVAKRYARAFFSAARAEGMVAAMDADLRSVADALHTSAAFRDFMARPSTSEADKLAMFDKVFGDRITSMTHQAVRLVIEKRRDEYLTAISKEFSDLRRHDELVTRAVVTTADTLGQVERDKIVAKLEADLGRKVEAEFDTDASLIGGVRIVYDNYILDGSVRGQLDKLRDKILYDVLKQG